MTYDPLRLHSSSFRAIRHLLALWISRYDMSYVMLLLCILVIPELLYSCLCTVIIRCAFLERYYNVLSVHVLLSWSIVLVFRHVLLWWWQVIVLSFCWCCIPALHGHFSTHTVLIILDNDLIMTQWFPLLPIMDYEYLSCHLYRWLYWTCLLYTSDAADE